MAYKNESEMEAAAKEWEEHLATNGSHPLCASWPFPCNHPRSHRDIDKWADEQRGSREVRNAYV